MLAVEAHASLRIATTRVIVALHNATDIWQASLDTLYNTQTCDNDHFLECFSAFLFFIKKLLKHLHRVHLAVKSTICSQRHCMQQIFNNIERTKTRFSTPLLPGTARTNQGRCPAPRDDSRQRTIGTKCPHSQVGNGSSPPQASRYRFARRSVRTERSGGTCSTFIKI